MHFPDWLRKLKHSTVLELVSESHTNCIQIMTESRQTFTENPRFMFSNRIPQLIHSKMEFKITF